MYEDEHLLNEPFALKASLIGKQKYISVFKLYFGNECKKIVICDVYAAQYGVTHLFAVPFYVVPTIDTAHCALGKDGPYCALGCINHRYFMERDLKQTCTTRLFAVPFYVLPAIVTAPSAQQCTMCNINRGYYLEQDCK